MDRHTPIQPSEQHKRTPGREVRLYNVLFPLWLLIFIPSLWLIIIPGNFIIDSIVLLIAMAALKITDRKRYYLRHIFKIFGFGMISDMVGAGFMLLMIALGLARTGDELYMTVLGLLLAAGLIFVLNYFITFRGEEGRLRLRLALIFAVATAPYTFLVPTGWIYG